MAWVPWNPSAADQARGIQENQTVTTLVADPTDVPEYLVIRGLLGRSSRQDVWRIYLGYELSEYYEVAAADIVLAAAAGAVTRVWIRRSAPVRYIAQRRWEPEVEYLAGEIADQARQAAKLGDTSRDSGEFGPEPTKCGQCGTRSC